MSHSTIPSQPPRGTARGTYRQPTEPPASDALITDDEHLTHAHGGVIDSSCARCVRLVCARWAVDLAPAVNR